MNNLTDISVIRNIFEKHGFSFSKTLGQNFLINPTVCPRIAELGNAKKGFGVIEIGTGIGVLTKELAERAEKVVAIEIDSRLIPILEETLADYDNVTIINADVMKVDLAEIIAEHFAGLEVAVCANLPYYITSPIIMMLLESRLPINSITVMVQKEAATRLTAKLGTREVGAVTIAVRYYSEPELLFNVSAGSFMPAPNVNSAVIKLNIHNGENAVCVSNEKLFFRVVRGSFEQRRKTLLNSLASAMKLSKAEIEPAITGANLPLTIRPEQLSMEDFVNITNNLEVILCQKQ